MRAETDRRLQDAMRRSLRRLRRLASLAELRRLADAGTPVFVLFTAEGCDHCEDALFTVADLVRRHETSVVVCWASLEDNHDIILNYAVTEYPSAIVLRRGGQPVRISGREIADPGSARRALNAASRR
jgi:uncharacterized protein with PhoU and TrkA domain